ncbi:MAG: hypothetical protein VKQ33_10625 [Candidatus Sericytochromatia bacterium]|nr:hypothetical protein [Candidatus Sericytochromatia bacterium]
MRVEAAVFALLGVLFVPFAWCSIWGGDELNFLYYAQRLAAGDVFFRDLHHHNPPLPLWLQAAVFWAVGPSLLAARVVTGLVLAACGVWLLRLVRLLGGGPAAGVLAALGLLLGLFPAFPGWSHHWFALLACLVGLERLIAATEGGRLRDMAAVGALTGVALWTTQPDGVALALVAGATVIGGWAAGCWDARQVGRWLAAGGLGLVAVLAPLLAVFAGQGVLAAAWHDTWVWPLRWYRQPGGFNDFLVAADLGPLMAPLAEPWTSRLAYFARLGRLGGLYVGVLAACAAALAVLVALAAGAARGRPPGPGPRRWAIVGLATLAFTAVTVRGRADLAHVAMYAPLALALVAAGTGRAAGLALPWSARLLAWLPLGLLAAFVVAGGVGVGERIARQPEAWLSVHTPDARLRAAPAIRWLVAHTRPEDRILALPVGGFYYFFSGRRSVAPGALYLPPQARALSPDQVETLRRSIVKGQPPVILVLPDLGTAAEVRAILRWDLPAYREVARVDTPVMGRPRPTWVFARQPGR